MASSWFRFFDFVKNLSYRPCSIPVGPVAWKRFFFHSSLMNDKPVLWDVLHLMRFKIFQLEIIVFWYFCKILEGYFGSQYNIVNIKFIGTEFLCGFRIRYSYCLRTSVTLLKWPFKIIIWIMILALWCHSFKMRSIPACHPGVCSWSAGLVHWDVGRLLLSYVWRYRARLQ